MALDTHVRRGHPILFGLLLLFGIIEGANTSYLTAKYNDDTRSIPNNSVRDRIRFLVFASWWTVFFSAGYLAVFFTSARDSFIGSIASHGAWIALTWIFWLAGAAAITAALGGGLACAQFLPPYCGQLNAAIGFAWIEFILFTILLIVITFIGTAALRRGDRLSSGLTA